MANLTEAQHAARANGIGGSDAAVVCGLSRWKTPVELWQEKTGQVEPEDLDGKEFVQWGKLLEDVIADEWARRHGRRVRRQNITRVDKALPFLVGNIDRDIVGLREGLECKNSSAWMADEWGEDGSDEVPDFYLIQGVHYMRVMDYDAWNFAVLLGGNELRSYRIERDHEIERMVIDIESDFWNDSVLGGEAPAPVNVHDLARLNPNATGCVQATDEIAALVAESAQIKARKKEDEQRLEAIKLEVGIYLGDKSDLMDPIDPSITIATMRARKGNQYIDVKDARAINPGLVDEYNELTKNCMKRGRPSRPFLVK